MVVKNDIIFGGKNNDSTLQVTFSTTPPCKWVGIQTIPTPPHSHERNYMNPLHPKPPPPHTNPTQTFELIM